MRTTVRLWVRYASSCVCSYCPLALIISTNVKALFPKAVRIGEDWGSFVVWKQLMQFNLPTCSNCCFGVKFPFGFEWGKQCGAMRIETCNSIQSAYWLAEPWISLRKMPMLKFNNDSFQCFFYTITSIRVTVWNSGLHQSTFTEHWWNSAQYFYCCCTGPFSSTLNDDVQVGMGPLVQDVFHVFLICLL